MQSEVMQLIGRELLRRNLLADQQLDQAIDRVQSGKSPDLLHAVVSSGFLSARNAERLFAEISAQYAREHLDDAEPESDGPTIEARSPRFGGGTRPTGPTVTPADAAPEGGEAMATMRARSPRFADRARPKRRSGADALDEEMETAEAKSPRFADDAPSADDADTERRDRASLPHPISGDVLEVEAEPVYPDAEPADDDRGAAAGDDDGGEEIEAEPEFARQSDPAGRADVAAKAAAAAAAAAATAAEANKAAEPKKKKSRAVLHVDLQDKVFMGRYLVKDLIGVGGMGAVWLAVDQTLEKEVAIKVLPPQLTADEQYRARFLREAKAAAKLEQHPNIVSVYLCDEDKDRGCLFMVMQFVRGQSLQDYVDKALQGPMSEDQALPVIRQVLDALRYAHEQGIVHRDIKPDNILLEAQTEQVCITDFGLARFEGSNSRLTAVGQVMGTPHFMSPEQAEGKTVDFRTDLYSAGCVFYYLLTHKYPFDGNNATAIILAHLRNPLAPIKKLVPGISPKLDALVTKLLARKPQNRYQTAADALRDLDAKDVGTASAPIEFQDDDDDDAAAAAPASVADKPAHRPQVRKRPRPQSNVIRPAPPTVRPISKPVGSDVRTISPAAVEAADDSAPSSAPGGGKRRRATSESEVPSQPAPPRRRGKREAAEPMSQETRMAIGASIVGVIFLIVLVVLLNGC